MKLQHLSEISKIEPGEYVVVRVNGLYGDLLHATCKFQYIHNKYPNANWIMIHSYGIAERVETCVDLLKSWIDSDKLKYYFYDHYTKSSPLQPYVRNKLNGVGITNDRIFDCFVFQGKPPLITAPFLGIDIPQQKDKNKAVIFRYSGWHGHFPARNRPIEEWTRIEQHLLKKGYTVHLLGKDDPLPNPNRVIDHRGQFTIREGLDFAKDASICITTTTFFYVWMQFVCPTMVLSEGGDVPNLNRYWKLHPNMQVVNINSPTYLNQVINFIDHVRSGE